MGRIVFIHILIVFFKASYCQTPPQEHPVNIIKTTGGTLNELIRKNFEGKRVFLDVWATWCGPCLFEFKSCDADFYSFLKSESITPVYVSIDNNNKKKKWEADINNLGLEGFHTRANLSLINSIAKTIFDGGDIIIPRYVLIDADGSIISKDFLRPSNPTFKESLKKAFDK